MALNSEVVPVWSHPAIESYGKTTAVSELGTRLMEKVSQTFEVVWEPHVVVGEIGDMPAASLPQSGVAIGVADASRFGEVEPSDARITERGDDVRRVVRAPVTGDQELEVVHGLPERAADGVRQDVRPVVGG
jgi:hypothetical protein